MVDRIQIDKILNGYVVKSTWKFDSTERDVYYPDLTGVNKHIEDCYVKVEKQLKK